MLTRDLFFGLFCVACYFLASLGFGLRLFYSQHSTMRRWASLALALAVVTHFFLLAAQIVSEAGVNLGVFNALSITAWLMAIIALVEQKHHPDLALLVSPLCTLFVVISLFFQTQRLVEVHTMWMIELHILASLSAYAVLGVAAIQAALIVGQDYFLKHHKTMWLRRLPSLMAMERLLFRLLGIGFILLTLALATGLGYYELLFTKPFIHKTALSLIAWCSFGSLLLAHHGFGLRGRIALRWTLLTFTLLAIGFIGSKWVQEVLLERG